MLHDIISMPLKDDANTSKKLVALPSRKVPFLIPGALRQPQTIAFALKISLCATLCYIIYLAVGWPGISTSVATVFIAGLGTSGALKQRLIFRVAGSLIGGLIFALGAIVFLFPHMDSITSLVFSSSQLPSSAPGWPVDASSTSSGCRPPSPLTWWSSRASPLLRSWHPPRDRLVGILLALVIMAFVFDQLWPVRNVTAMRSSLATILRGVAVLLRQSRTDRRILAPG